MSGIDEFFTDRRSSGVTGLCSMVTLTSPSPRDCAGTVFPKLIMIRGNMRYITTRCDIPEDFFGVAKSFKRERGEIVDRLV